MRLTGMFRRVVRAGGIVAACLLGAGCLQAFDANAELQARKVMEDFMTAFNARDVAAWAATLNYPHVRFASNDMRIYNTTADFVQEMRDYPKNLAPWHHSRWESMTVVQSGDDKVHFAVTFVRFDANNKEIGKFPSLYIVTRKNGHWGVQARSSFAP
jgi:ketosteroid isomerase-like protein